MTVNMSHAKPHSIDELGAILLHRGKPVDTGHWQAMKGVPQTKTIELMNVVYQLGIPRNREDLDKIVKPSMTWAELQFQERVSGLPVNPGETYKLWPWYRGNVEKHQQQREWDPDSIAPGIAVNRAPKTFSHTYMERFWPRQANGGQYEQYGSNSDNVGIRYRYGDLNDVIALLAREPFTRQAYLPIFFPEDTGAHHGERIPCSLGYHFLLREGRLHVNYTIRSCDFLRHFRDDVYMAARLCQWVLNKLQDIEMEACGPAYMAEHGGDLWNPGDIGDEGIKPGTLTMMMHSLHVFEGDLPKMRKEYG